MGLRHGGFRIFLRAACLFCLVFMAFFRGDSIGMFLGGFIRVLSGAITGSSTSRFD